MTSGNRVFMLPDGVPELDIITTSAATAVFTVPAGEKWLVLHAVVVNATQTSRSAYSVTIDGTNASGFIVGDSPPGAGSSYAPTSFVPFIVPAGGKVTTKSVSFTASDTVIHTVLHQTIKYG